MILCPLSLQVSTKNSRQAFERHSACYGTQRRQKCSALSPQLLRPKGASRPFLEHSRKSLMATCSSLASSSQLSPRRLGSRAPLQTVVASRVEAATAREEQETTLRVTSLELSHSTRHILARWNLPSCTSEKTKLSTTIVVTQFKGASRAMRSH